MVRGLALWPSDLTMVPLMGLPFCNSRAWTDGTGQIKGYCRRLPSRSITRTFDFLKFFPPIGISGGSEGNGSSWPKELEPNQFLSGKTSFAYSFPFWNRYSISDLRN